MKISPAVLPPQFHSGGKQSAILGWILFSLTSVYFIYGIVQAHKQIAVLKKEDTDVQKKLAELELNVKAVVGERNYKKVSA